MSFTIYNTYKTQSEDKCLPLFFGWGLDGNSEASPYYKIFIIFLNFGIWSSILGVPNLEFFFFQENLELYKQKYSSGHLLLIGHTWRSQMANGLKHHHHTLQLEHQVCFTIGDAALAVPNVAQGGQYTIISLCDKCYLSWINLFSIILL